MRGAKASARRHTARSTTIASCICMTTKPLQRRWGELPGCQRCFGLRSLCYVWTPSMDMCRWFPTACGVRDVNEGRHAILKARTRTHSNDICLAKLKRGASRGRQETGQVYAAGIPHCVPCTVRALEAMSSLGTLRCDTRPQTNKSSRKKKTMQSSPGATTFASELSLLGKESERLWEGW